MRAALYARVSTDDQDCSLQLEALRSYCAGRKWEVAEEYIDQGWSGKVLARPALSKLKTDARTRKFDAVLVWKLDRWGRSTVDAIQGIQELSSLGIRWVSITQGFDTDESNPASRLMLTIMAAFAEFEREMIRERTRAGMKARAHKGVHCGRPKAVVDRRKLRDLKASGVSVREIAKRLRISKSAVQRLCRA